MFRVRGSRAERCGGNRSDARLAEGGKVYLRDWLLNWVIFKNISRRNR